VIASLIFVGFEVRQNTAAVRGATYQSIADASLEQVRWFADNERLLGFRARVEQGALEADFTREENLLQGADYIMTIRRIENIFVQVREGLVGEEAILRFRPSQEYFESSYFREFWTLWGPQLEPQFRAYFEREFLD
jgi:hypothetical protein